MTLQEKNFEIVRDSKIRNLYLQSAKQQWSAAEALDFSKKPDLPKEILDTWSELSLIFFTLEKMGLMVLSNMFTKASQKLKSEETLLYLTLQCADEGRHVYAIENYLSSLGTPPKYDWKFHVLGQVSSWGFYRVENWLFSTLFSESFASAFLRRAKNANIDSTGSEMCRRLLIDESRHLHFLHIVLPDVLDRLSVLGKAYVKMSQYFIMRFTVAASKALETKGADVGINRKELLEEVFENIERSYAQFGVNRDFLYFPSPSR